MLKLSFLYKESVRTARHILSLLSVSEELVGNKSVNGGERDLISRLSRPINWCILKDGNVRHVRTPVTHICLIMDHHFHLDYSPRSMRVLCGGLLFDTSRSLWASSLSSTRSEICFLSAQICQWPQQRPCWGQQEKWMLTVRPHTVSPSACQLLLQFKSLLQRWANVSLLSCCCRSTGQRIVCLSRPFHAS